MKDLLMLFDFNELLKIRIYTFYYNKKGFCWDKSYSISGKHMIYLYNGTRDQIKIVYLFGRKYEELIDDV